MATQIEIPAVTPYKEATWGETGVEIIPSSFYQVYKVEGPWLGDDENCGLCKGFEYYDTDKKETVYLKSTASIALNSESPVKGEDDPNNYGYKNYESNKYGQTSPDDVIDLTITVDPTLKAMFPLTLVRIDGKYVDLKALESPITLKMFSGDHRIKIEWSNEYVEVFRVKALR